MPKVDLGTFPNQSLVILLALLNFLLLFVQLCVIIICFHPRPFQHTSPQYVRLDVHLTDVPQLQTRSSTLTKKLHSCAVPFVFSCQAPCQASFRPLPLGLKFVEVAGHYSMSIACLSYRSHFSHACCTLGISCAVLCGA